ncbi:MAG TPA: aldehyde dehydrogenase family protein, partial [Actinomycetota bacterium]|nr:aldehyde dehydrogenase family protein [Actinomycetota bacterium]
MTTAIRRAEMFIGGDWVDAATGEMQPVIEPSTGEPFAEVAKGSEADVDRAVAAAREAFPGWMDATPRTRSEALLKLAGAIEENAEELAQLESRNVGKPYGTTLSDELGPLVDNLRFFAGASRLLEGRSTGEYMEGYTSMIRREPVGVVGSIAPWNYPLMMAVWKIAPALAAGNTVVLKPSEWTPLTALRMAELAADLFPPGVLNVVTGDGVPVGAALVRHPDVDMVSLTGDVATGKEVARAAAESLKRVHLELGGKAPVLVFDDADVEAVVEGVKVGGFFNAGQDCTAATRVIAGPRIHGDLIDGLVPAIESLAVGDPTDERTEMGPLVSSEQLDRVNGFVERARKGGANVLTGGEPFGERGFFFRPSVVA